MMEMPNAREIEVRSNTSQNQKVPRLLSTLLTYTHACGIHDARYERAYESQVYHKDGDLSVIKQFETVAHQAVPPSSRSLMDGCPVYLIQSRWLSFLLQSRSEYIQ